MLAMVLKADTAGCGAVGGDIKGSDLSSGSNAAQQLATGAASFGDEWLSCTLCQLQVAFLLPAVQIYTIFVIGGCQTG